MSTREIELPGGRLLEINQASAGEELAAEAVAGAVVWDSALVLIHYLAKLQQQQQQQQQHVAAGPHTIPPLRGARVLELGAGTGAVGCAAAALGASRVLLTDRPQLLELIESNIQANNLSAVASAAACEWGVPLPAAVTEGGPWDLVVLSDLVYEPAALGPLIETLSALLGGDGAHGAAAAAAAGAPTSNGNVPARASSGAGGGGGGGSGPVVLVAVELRVDTGVAQFVRQLVSRRYLVERVPASELSEDWQDDDIWVFTVQRAG